MTNKTKRVYKAPALEKGLEIIELLAMRQVPMSMTEIAASLGRSGNEIFRMLSVLEQRNYIRKREGSDRYVITNHLFDLGMRVPPNSTLVEHLVPRMRQLADAIRQSCHLSVVSGHHIVVIARVESPSPVGFSVRVGTSRGLLESAAGRVFLAWMDDVRRERTLAAIAEAAGAQAQPARLADDLLRIREQGYARMPSTFITGITDICVPVAAGDPGKVVATLTVPFAAGSDAPMPLDETLPLILDSVAGMSRDATVLGGF
ncbi:MAG TPA: IclR family transcriptional regulator [Woeseiaceae bacterium]|nr:IclR family transcriptional regulator [Woeseiaceae bacterium]